MTTPSGPADSFTASDGATTLGGQILGQRLGQQRKGFLADPLLVDGDPTENVVILENKHMLKALMKDGVLRKTPEARA